MVKRATKKQKELFNYIDNFIKGNGYGPSYREVMHALDYKSVSTVSAHVDGLVAAGYLKKSGSSARSLEVIEHTNSSDSNIKNKDWLRRELTKLYKSEKTPEADKKSVKDVARLLDVEI